MTAFDRGLGSDRLVQVLLAERLAADPGLQKLLPLLGVGGLADPTAPDTRAPGTGPSAGRGDLAADRTEACRQFDRVGVELQRCHALLDRIAAALGACANCLGFEGACIYCRGTGAPGSRPIDGDEFHALIAPLLDRNDTAAGSAVPPPPTENGRIP